MSLLHRVMSEPELVAEPPVLVDVGAAGGMHRAWKALAPYSIGVSFEPDSREAPAPGAAQAGFKEWIFCPGLAVPETTSDGQQELYLTRSPQCSSTLKPDVDSLRDWSFASFFDVVESRRFPATTVMAALQARGIHRIDWLKCDTQGLDLRLFLSLPDAVKRGLISVEFEPGVIDAYRGEDPLAEVLKTMRGHPFWLSELSVVKSARASAQLVAGNLGPALVPWVRRLSPGAPGWVNVRFVREVGLEPQALDRRSHLLAWAVATVTGQPGYGLKVAAAGGERYGGELFSDLLRSSAWQLRWSLLRGLPAFVARRLIGG